MQIINLNKISLYILFFTNYVYNRYSCNRAIFFCLLVYFLLQKNIKSYFFDKKFLFLIIFSIYVFINAVIQIDDRDLYTPLFSILDTHYLHYWSLFL